MLVEEICSISCSPSTRWIYHIFLSFRGEDTRFDFTDYIYAALIRKGIITFRDDKQLEKGDVIGFELFKAIEQSLGAIIVLSKNYASSTWCLDELQKIIESKRVLGIEVFPVFYGVSPHDVLYQRDSFEVAFEKHARRYDVEKVQKWRDSCKEVATIPGWASNNWDETELIDSIVESVWTKLRPKMPSYDDELVGIDSRVEKMEKILRMELKNEIQLVGIWGMGGIGKTTLARVVFKKMKTEFDISCFLENVREISQDIDGVLSLQRKLLSSLNIKGLEIGNLDEGKNTIRNLLSNKKVLLVVDDVDDIRQLESLVDRFWFGFGSRVIVTTRDKHVLTSHGIIEQSYYKIDVLNLDESLQLLSQKAFKRDQPHEHYLELSKVVVQYTCGLPLALNLLGSFLCGRSESQWKEVVDMIQQVPPNEIVKKSLRISYNGLPHSYKTLFLDVACFFKGWVKEICTQILQICDRYPLIGIELLIEKSLASYDGFRLEMHDLLQETGREIVLQECPIDPTKRTRLWSLKDIEEVLNYNNKTSESILGIVINSLPKSYEAKWDPEAFSRMCNLKFLIINHNVQLPRGLKYLCRSMKFLQWMEYPLEALPDGVQLDEIVELRMHHSKIKKIWSETQFFAKLKFIDLSFSKNLIETPIVSGAPCLESMLLIGCTNLVEVHKSVAQHKKLVVLYMKGCKNLKTLPTKFEMDSLKELILSGCSKVKKLPEFGNNMKCLSLLNLEDCENLLSLPNSIQNLKSLKKLYISGCTKFSKLPHSMNENECLEELDLRGTAIRDITLSKIHLENLKEFSYGGRKQLANNSGNMVLRISKFRRQQNPKELILPPLSSLLALTSLNLSYCNLNDESIHNLGSLKFLQELDLSGNFFINPPAYCISDLFMLQRLSLANCPILESLPVLPQNVQSFYATNSTQLNPLNLDPQRLWKIFESHFRLDQMESWPELWYIIPGSEIPSWFDNQECNFINSSQHPYDKLGCDSITSIIVNVPDYCQSSEWWGIAVCLILEPISNSSSSHDVKPNSTSIEEECTYYWVCKDPNREADQDYPIASKYGHLVYEFNDPNIHIIFLTGEHIYIQHYLSGGKDQLQLVFYIDNFSKHWKASITKCGCRVICKEDIEYYSNGLPY